MLAVESKILNEAIANYMMVNGAVNTTEGNYIFSVSELAEHFGVNTEYIMAQADNIKDCLNGDVLIEYDFYEDSYEKEYVFDITFYDSYCGIFEED